MRFSLALPLLASVACINAAAVPAKVSKRDITPTDPTYQQTCSGVTLSQLESLVCPVALVGGMELAFTGANINTNADSLLKSVESLFSSTPEVQDLSDAITTGIVSNILYSVTGVLYALNTELFALDPNCQCDIDLCQAALTAAKDDASSQNEQLQASCEYAKYYCGAFYDSSNVNTMVPECSAFSGTTR